MSVFTNNVPPFGQQPGPHFSHQPHQEQGAFATHLDNNDSDDLFDDSFASTISLTSPKNDTQHFDMMSSSPGYAMDICSPTPFKGLSQDHFQVATMREFSTDQSQTFKPSLFYKTERQRDQPTIKQSNQTSKTRARARTGIPDDWMTTRGAREQLPTTSVTMDSLCPASDDSDAMDIDSPTEVKGGFEYPPRQPEASFGNRERSNTDSVFATYFYDEATPETERVIPKSQYLSAMQNDENNHGSSSPVASPTAQRYNRGAGTKALSFIGTKPTAKPSLQTTLALMNKPGPSALQGRHEGEIQSAGVVPSLRMAAVPPRRTVSAFIQPGAPITGNGTRTKFMLGRLGQTNEHEEEFDSSPSLKLPNTRHLKGASIGGNLRIKNSPLARPSAKSPLRPLPQFGHSEMDGKLLPCQGVKQDGLMRIDPPTLMRLIMGEFNSHITTFRVIDCRFEYEYQGGHVPGAINLNTAEMVEQFLLKEVALPPPSRSGDGRSEKVVLIFHCEFSAVRGPTLAKHLRSKDRALNAHSYPNVHYPELYILEGGYCNFFKHFPQNCDPPNYIKMDAPQHGHARASDLNQFRKWNRTQSYTYGERSQLPSKEVVSKPTIVPLGPPRPRPASMVLQYTAGTSSQVHKRGQSNAGLQTLEEDYAAFEANKHEESEVRASLEETDDDVGRSSDVDISFASTQDASFEEEGDERQQGEETEEAEEFEEEYSFNLPESSPCVTAEMNAAKNKKFFGQTFKPFTLGSARGLGERAVSYAV